MFTLDTYIKDQISEKRKNHGIDEDYLICLSKSKLAREQQNNFKEILTDIAERLDVKLSAETGNLHFDECNCIKLNKFHKGFKPRHILNEYIPLTYYDFVHSADYILRGGWLSNPKKCVVYNNKEYIFDVNAIKDYGILNFHKTIFDIVNAKAVAHNTFLHWTREKKPMVLNLDGSVFSQSEYDTVYCNMYGYTTSNWNELSHYSPEFEPGCPLNKCYGDWNKHAWTYVQFNPFDEEEGD
jgi:hypothetical protein